MSAPWPFVAWGMDVIGHIDLAVSNGHRFILVAIDYFTKWVEAKTFKSVTKKVVVDFVRSNIICRFGIPKFCLIQRGKDLKAHYQLLKMGKSSKVASAEYLGNVMGNVKVQAKGAGKVRHGYKSIQVVRNWGMRKSVGKSGAEKIVCQEEFTVREEQVLIKFNRKCGMVKIQENEE
ncbi:uncharacterized protein [Nicotiana sylvestris]|uniref:uncharacterized protein n=1 Tax=Nicotiana sylvestris TaxID=4096 RepID=UPI00388CE3F1